MSAARRLLGLVERAADHAATAWGDAAVEAAAWQELREAYGSEWSDVADAARAALRELDAAAAEPGGVPRG